MSEVTLVKCLAQGHIAVSPLSLRSKTILSFCQVRRNDKWDKALWFNHLSSRQRHNIWHV